LAFIDPANGGVPETTPASVTHNGAKITSTGSSVTQIDADLTSAIQALVNAEMPLSTATWVMAPTTAAALSLKRGSGGAPAYPGITVRGGSLCGLPVLTSTSCTATGSPGERFIALVEAGDILYADDGQAEISISGEATLQMNDAPSGGDQQGVSLWQNGLAAIRATRFVNWQARRSGAAAVIESVSY
jgi:HK97 family phage major capsid protein